MDPHHTDMIHRNDIQALIAIDASAALPVALTKFPFFYPVELDQALPNGEVRIEAFAHKQEAVIASIDDQPEWTTAQDGA